MSLNHYTINVQTQVNYLDYASYFTVTVYSSSDNTNIFRNYTGLVDFNSTDPNAVFFDPSAPVPSVPIGSYSFTPSDRGVHKFLVIFGTVGSQTIEVFDDLTETFDTIVDVNVLSGAPSVQNTHCNQQVCSNTCYSKSNSNDD
jgi:hypothetical protein